MKPFSLARQNTLLLAAAFMLVELLAALSFAFFLMLPVARRSADDLAGLMMLSAQTWAELPPDTRMAFEHELMNNHQLALRAEPAGNTMWYWADLPAGEGALAVGLPLTRIDTQPLLAFALAFCSGLLFAGAFAW